ncbi:hypothetical protein L2E82_17080 [Cichorium intybus]|uniref:Uncharacterized protein n=1 Tax=Cichorium intybus TaxID=13427 RepID=A0ACB9F7C4_CICIN|nr:hypothetical protein L2E82_17080 [Cichorium intybus]
MSSKGIKRHSATASSSKRGSSKGSKSGEPKEPTLHFGGRTQKNKFKALQDREVKPTRFMHADSFQTLGVLGGVVALFQNIGWGPFLNLHAYTFETPTREFLSSFERNDNERRVTFRLQEMPLSLAYDDMNRIMESYTSSRSKATDIIHPCIRLAHRILVCTIFAHKEVGQVGKWELYFLWCMTRAVPSIPDFASFFLQRDFHLVSFTGSDTIFGSPRPRIVEFNPRIPDSWIITRTIHEREEALANHGGDDEPMQEAHAPQEFPPDFFTRFDALCLQTEQLHQRVGSIWDWHIQEGHFDYSPPNPPM